MLRLNREKQTMQHEIDRDEQREYAGLAAQVLIEQMGADPEATCKLIAHLIVLHEREWAAGRNIDVSVDAEGLTVRDHDGKIIAFTQFVLVQ